MKSGVGGGGVVLVEQLLNDGGDPPLEVKIYAFQGIIGLLMLVSPTAEGIRKRMYLDATGHCLKPMVDLDKCDQSIPIPERLDTVMQHASAISSLLPLPYVRVDFYHTPAQEQEWTFGELTTAPGVGLFPRPLDTQLGRLWEESMERLLFRGEALPTLCDRP